MTEQENHLTQEVTPEMLSAGVRVLEIYRDSADDHFLVREVYIAMQRERAHSS
jgi:hypothetical protein